MHRSEFGPGVADPEGMFDDPALGPPPPIDSPREPIDSPREPIDPPCDSDEPPLFACITGPRTQEIDPIIRSFELSWAGAGAGAGSCGPACPGCVPSAVPGSAACGV